ncbi:MAG: chemotaxis protein CheX [Sulfurimonas sp.]
MLNTIEEAAINFCIHQIGEDHTLSDGITKKRTFIAYIDLDAQGGKRYRAYIASDQGFMQKVSKLFLEEDESDEETLCDMTLETANLIIGSAKVIAEEQNDSPYTINTPFFEKIGEFDCQCDDAKTLIVGDSEITIAIKDLDAS